MNRIRNALVIVDQWGRFPLSDLDDIDVVLPGLQQAWELDLVTEDSSGFDCGPSFSLARAGREYLHGRQLPAALAVFE